ncbi:MAG: ABC transporter permease [Candidatus Aminicenantes bacterium]|uniref:Transport permease protein n=1 Tax=Candidatus Saccharicenans subterraneus TaxID=2508984 RepID=A0A3E2BMA9_9BACT|nr:ABC transporter permease [Candidatus Aminicenantes bacterium]RFT15861.1 MAG: ABC-type multidrug transport system, permease component [Candidatus Saccharicenans subterraneum]
MKRLLAFIRKELLQVRRDRRMLPIVIIAPIFQLLILGYAVSLDVRDIPVVVVDLDHSDSSRDFLRAVFNSGYFVEAGREEVAGRVDRYLDSGRASVALVIPEGFERDLLAGKPTSFQGFVDGTESQTATIGLNYLEMIARNYNQKIILQALGKMAAGMRPVVVRPEVRVFFNPALVSRNFLLPGVFGLLLMVMTVILTAMAVVKEYDRGTMEQLIVTPLRPLDIILGKLLPFFIIGTVDVFLIFAVTRFWFRLPLRGSFLLLLGLSFVYMLSTLGIGLFISTITRTPQQAMLTSFFFMIPMMMLSGFVFPIENMPKFFQWLTYIIPLRYYLVVLRGIFLKGVNLSALYDEALWLLGLAVAINLLSVSRFRRRLD